MALEMGSFFKRGPRERRRPADEPTRAEAARPAPRTVMIERRDEGRTMQLVDRLLAFKLPWIGDKPVNTQVQVLLILLGLCFVVISRHREDAAAPGAAKRVLSRDQRALTHRGGSAVLMQLSSAARW